MLCLTKSIITVTIEDALGKKIRLIQSQLLSKTNSNWSYSKVVSIILEEGLRSFSVEKAVKKYL